VSSEIVALLPELDGDDLMHYGGDDMFAELMSEIAG